MNTFTDEQRAKTARNIADDATERMIALRAQLAKAVTNEALTGSVVADIGADLSGYELIHRHFTRIAAMYENGRGHEVADRITEMLLAGADDTWSGRSNDARRAAFDMLRHRLDGFMVYVR